MKRQRKPLIPAAIIVIFLLCGFTARAALRAYSERVTLGGGNAVILALPDFSVIAEFGVLPFPEFSTLPLATSGLPPLLTTAAETAPPETSAPETSAVHTTKAATTKATTKATTRATTKATTAEAPETEPPAAEPYDELTFVYGKSEAGRDLVCHRLRSVAGEHKRAILLVFEIHGFEDAYDRDGQLLCDIAEKLLAHYRQNIGTLCGCELYVVPSANPDGLLDGESCFGFGRCQKSGYDINREFDAGNWSPCADARYKTGDAPLTSCESAALYNLVTTIAPDIVIDFHGWLDMCIGDRALYNCFNACQPIYYQSPFSSASGYFSAWAATVADRALLYEFPWPVGYSKSYYVSTNASRVAQGLNKICKSIDSLVGP